MALITRKVPPNVVTNFRALSGTVLQQKKKYPIRASLKTNREGIPKLYGSGPTEWLLRKGQVYKADLQTSEGWKVICEGCVNIKIKNLNRFVAQPSSIRASFGHKLDISTAESYALFLGGDNLIGGDTFDQNRSRTVINLDLLGRIGAELYGVKIGKGKKEIGYLYMPCNGLSREFDWQLLKRLRLLLTLAYSRFISIPWYGRFDSKGNAQIEITAPMDPGHAGSLLYVGYPSQISKLIKNGWPRWDSVGRGLELQQLIYQYILVRNQVFLEASIMLACVWMEAFKYQYAKNVQHYITDRNNFFLRPRSRLKFNFKELVEEGMRYFGISSPYLGFIDIRNEVIHTGTITASMSEKKEVRFRLQKAIEEFFFTLFNFNGLVWSNKQGNWVQRK